VQVNLIQDHYFATVGTPLLRGRDLNEADILLVHPVAVITEDMAKREFSSGAGPLGHHIQIDLFNQPIPPQILKAPNFANSFEIVGVVGNARNRGLDQPAMAAVFLPYSMVLPPDGTVLARTNGKPDKLAGVARECVRSVDRSQPITEVRTLEYWLDTAMAYQSFSTFIFGVFGGVGLLLAGAGVFSVVSYSVQRRTREFGIRMALGASTGGIIKLVLSATTRVLALGLLIGIALSIFASRALSNKMQGMGTGDPYLFVLVPTILVFVTLAASYVPARFASRIHPSEALRQE